MKRRLSSKKRKTKKLLIREKNIEKERQSRSKLMSLSKYNTEYSIWISGRTIECILTEFSTHLTFIKSNIWYEFQLHLLSKFVLQRTLDRILYTYFSVSRLFTNYRTDWYKFHRNLKETSTLKFPTLPVNKHRLWSLNL